jgi:hypothetical protein
MDGMTYRELIADGEVVDLVADVELQEGEHDQVGHVEAARVTQLLARG